MHPVKGSWMDIAYCSVPYLTLHNIHDALWSFFNTSMHQIQHRFHWFWSWFFFFFFLYKSAHDVSIFSITNPWTCLLRHAGSQCSHQRDFGLLSKLFWKHWDGAFDPLEKLNICCRQCCISYVYRKPFYIIVTLFFCDIDIYFSFCF